MAEDPTADPTIAARLATFGPNAAAYAQHRPDYPAEAIRWALAGAARPVRQVLDLAAGTGKLTDGLLALGLAVTAVEPDPGMRAEFARQHPDVPALDGTAEGIPLPDASVDAVLAGQAFHWFDLDRAFPECARVLRPGGVVAGLWNDEDRRVEWVAELARVRAETHGDPWPYESGMPASAGLEPFEVAQFAHVQRRTAESLTATIATYSHTAMIPAAQRAAILARIQAFLESRPEIAGGEFDLPLRTVVQRARRTVPPLRD
ncbi:MAG TPA: methyltransferase domain-containing protein [Actinophytocola sp.]|uniref:class I SAM-dependent methyltransferase n=1 Tax=Actinophytocola sp. TaxID=1872138 RepID=UPI002DBA00C1|nr:methyltransferase domain-containing protein [Actinophytocola sp.]HEU5471832.1 methyltransferase domain-containing protein [Actinophytocola sp.]